LNYYNYFTEIEDEFVRRRGSHILISPLDWSLIETWQQRGVPLHIALRGINASFDSYDERLRRGRKVNSLFYCQQEVEALFLEYCEMRVGSNGQGEGHNESAAPGNGHAQATAPFSPETIAGHLAERGEVIAGLAACAADPSLAETFTRAARRLGEIIANLTAASALDAERLEADLTGIEELLLGGLRERAGPEGLTRLRREGDEQLRAYRQRMGPEVYAQTLENYVARRLREQHRVPRLSLFYL
jgi:hypothetical protein